MAKRLLNEAPDDLKLNNLHFSFRSQPFLSFHIITGTEQRLALYTINKVHTYLISPLRDFLLQLLKDYKPTHPSKGYVEPHESFRFVDVRHNRYMGYYDFNMTQFNEYTEKAKEFLKSVGIHYVELSNKRFSIYDMFYFVDAYNSPKNAYLGGRMWDRATLINEPSERAYYPACSMYKLEQGQLDLNTTKSSLLKICHAAYKNNELFHVPLVTNDMFVEYADKETFYIDLTPAIR